MTDFPNLTSRLRALSCLPGLHCRPGLRTAVACLALIASGAAQALPSFAEVHQAHRSSETVMLSREGEVLQRQRTNAQVRRGEWVALADVSPALRTALILSEDKRFYAHSGVDWAAVSAAAWGNLWNQRTRGASTITMQLAGLVDGQDLGDLAQRPGGRSVMQKLGQTVAAQVLDRRWRKDEILEAYLNLVPFRGELVGIDALSRSLYGKAAHGLNARESAVAAALIRAPNASAARVAQRACGVLQEMAAQDPLAQDCQLLVLWTSQVLQQRQWPAGEGLAPHLARRVLAQSAHTRPLSPQMRSTLSAPLQRFAVQSLQQHLRELQGRNVQDGAVLVLDNRSGEVLAWVGSSGELSQAAEVDGVTALRQPGSTLKPFLYAQALAERRITAASLIEDSSAQIATTSGLYIPQNYDRRFKGWVSARTALASSLNVPAVRTLVMVSPEPFFAQLQRLGMPLRESGGYYGYSLALGSAEVSLLDLTNAYRAMANGGRWSPALWQPVAPATAAVPAVQAIDGRAAFVVGDILSDRMARAPTFGTDSVLATRFWTAVKTGTSKDMRDNWAVGWSQRYTVGVWVGNARGDAMHGVSGTSGAAPIWADVMGFLHASTASQAPSPPPGLVQQAVRFGPDEQGQPLESARQEWFLAGTQQPLFAMDMPAPSAAAPAPRQRAGQPALVQPTAMRIARPASGSILALDPDIPPTHQRVQLQARSAGGATQASAQWLRQLRWRLVSPQASGAALQRDLGAGEHQSWMPWPGRHRIELLNPQGEVLDTVHIEVRGAGVRAAPAPRR